jgi:Flp pilus assembly pilin Flp
MNSRCCRNRLQEFWLCSKGATAVEYGIIVMAMFLAIIPGFLYVSTGVTKKFQGIANYFGSLV